MKVSASGDKYETTHAKIVGAIYRRLCQWGGDVQSTGTWLPADKACQLKALVRDFIDEYNLEKELVSRLQGWECALGQIVDADDAAVVSMLPYILTAYIYNFGEPATVRDREGSEKEGNTKRNRFVYSYLQGIRKRREKCDYDVFFGVVPGDFADENLVGIGKLLNCLFPCEDSRQRAKLKTLAGNFAFPQTMLECAGMERAYLVPKDSYKEFVKRRDRARTAIPGHDIVIQEYIWDDGRELFADAFWNIFLSWCYALLQRKEQECEIVSAVDFLESTWMICRALHDEERAELLESKVEKEGTEAASRWIEKWLVDEYQKEVQRRQAWEEQEQSDTGWDYQEGYVLSEE